MLGAALTIAYVGPPRPRRSAAVERYLTDVRAARHSVRIYRIALMTRGWRLCLTDGKRDGGAIDAGPVAW